MHTQLRELQEVVKKELLAKETLEIGERKFVLQVCEIVSVCVCAYGSVALFLCVCVRGCSGFGRELVVVLLCVGILYVLLVFSFGLVHSVVPFTCH